MTRAFYLSTYSKKKKNKCVEICGNLLLFSIRRESLAWQLVVVVAISHEWMMMILLESKLIQFLKSSQSFLKFLYLVFEIGCQYELYFWTFFLYIRPLWDMRRFWLPCHHTPQKVALTGICIIFWTHVFIFPPSFKAALNSIFLVKNDG